MGVLRLTPYNTAMDNTKRELVNKFVAELDGLKTQRRVAENDVHIATTRLGIIDQDMRQLENLIDRANAGAFPFDVRVETTDDACAEN